MRIRFGWLLDGAPWASRGAGAERSWDMVAGPRELVGVLLTRLGLSHPKASHAFRVAQMHRLLGEVDHAWYRRSRELDPWNTARTLLRLRDEAREAGWRAPEPREIDGVRFPRLQAVAALEQAATVGVEGVPGANLSPGFSDDLSSVHAELEALVEQVEPWPLGIEAIECAEDPASLPGRWPALFSLLAKLGVEVIVGELGSHVPRALTIIRAPQELSAGEVAVQILEEACTGEEAVTVLATRSTLPLDIQLARRGLPPVAHAPEAPPRLAAQVVPLFLEAVSAPVNVQALVEFLSFEVPCEKVGAAGEGQASAPVLARRVSRALLDALGEEAGIDASDPHSAFAKALAKIGEDAKNGERDLALVRELCAFTSLTPREGAMSVDEFERRLSFLEARVEEITKAAAPAKALIRAHITNLRELVALMGGSALGERELRDLVAAAAPSSSSVLTRKSVAPWTMASNEAHVEGGMVLWWGAAGVQGRRGATWDKSEVELLEAGGARVLEPEALEALDMGAKLRALGGARKIIAVAADVVDGEHASLSPVLAPLAGAWLEANPDIRARDTEESDPTRHRAVSIDARAWIAERVKQGILEVPEELRFMPPASLAREVTPGMHLMPATLSFTQLDTLHRDALSWVLRYPFGIKPGSAASVPTGDRAIGTLIHAVIETLVNDKLVPVSYEIPTGTIEEVFSRLVPRYASNLDLPGNEALRAYVLRCAKASIGQLFRAFRTAGVSALEIEHGLEGVSLGLEIEGSGSSQRISVPLSGSIDFVGIGENGVPVLLDFKWAKGTSRYASYVDSDESLQLATYAWAYGEQRSDKHEARIGYFMLRQGEFVTRDAGLGGRGNAGEGGRALFERLRTTIENELSAIAQGRVTSALGDLALNNGLSSYETAHKKAAAELAEARADSGRVFVDHNASYSDYCLLTGLTGDYS